jgi:HK97 family phage prohead protease
MKRLALVTKFGLDEAGTITGIAWPFGQPDRYGDVIEPGAFKGAAGKRLPMLFAHDQAAALGVWDGIEEKADGLHVSGRLLVDEVARAREVRALLREGAISGLSVGFLTKESKARPGGGRTFTKVELLEVSIVPVPAHAEARVTSTKSSSGRAAITAAFLRAAEKFN